jgi:hypothetical protein
MSVELDRLYDLIAQRTGITRKVDHRLEAIAADRALEARFTVGLDCIDPCEIPHPIDQLKARVWPLQGTFKGVWENAYWSYRADIQADPYASALEAWWNSPEHHDNLMRTDATTIGLGVYSEQRPGDVNRRWYFIATFAKDLLPDPHAIKVSYVPGDYTAYRFHSDGSVAAIKNAHYDRNASGATDGSAVINGQLYVHVTGGRLKGWWLHPRRYRS